MSDLTNYRGTGILDNNAPMSIKSIKQNEQLWNYARDAVSVNVLHIPTMTTAITIDEKGFEELVKKHRAPSPCPCRSNECLVEYEKEKKRYETLMSQASPTLPHASGIHAFTLGQK